MLSATCSTLYSQSKRSDYDRLKACAERINDCVLIERSYHQLQTDSLKMRREIDSKDSVINDLNGQVDKYRFQAALLGSRNEADKETISFLQSDNDKLRKPKRWGVGLMAGYGIAGQSFGAFIGGGISYGLRF